MNMMIATRVKQRLAELGLTQREVARRIGVNESQIRGIISGKITSPRTDNLQKLATELQCDIRYLLGEVDEATPLYSEPNSSRPRLVPVRLQAQTGAYIDLNLPPSRDIAPVAVNLPEFAEANLFAVAIADNSMDKVFPEGTILVAAPTLSHGLHQNDYAIIQRNRGPLTETFVRQVQEHKGVVKLTPHSNHAQYQTETYDPDDSSLVFIGVAVWAGWSPSSSGSRAISGVRSTKS